MVQLSPDDKMLGALFVGVSVAVAITQQTWAARILTLVLSMLAVLGVFWLIVLQGGCSPPVSFRVARASCECDCATCGFDASTPALEDAAPIAPPPSDAASAACEGAASGVNTFVPSASSSAAWYAQHPQPRDVADIQLQLDGQSNAEGQNVLRWEDGQAIEGASLLGYRVAAGVAAQHAWEPFGEPSNRYSTQPVSPGYGPAAGLAKRIREVTCASADGCKTVGVFVNAVSSTKLEQWARGTSSSTNKIWIEERGRAGGVRIDGVIRWLGDGNRTDPDALSKILLRVDELREDFAAPCMPMVWVEIMHATSAEPAYGTAFNAQLAQLPEFRVASAVVSAAGAVSYRGDMHVDHASAEAIGRRMADAWLRLKGYLP